MASQSTTTYAVSLNGGVIAECASLAQATQAAEQHAQRHGPGEYLIDTKIRVKCTKEKPSVVKPYPAKPMPAKPGVKPAPSASLDAIRAQLAAKAKK